MTTTQTTVDERVYNLVRPITFEGEEVTSLTLDFDGLTGHDLLTCARQAQTMSQNEVVFIRALSLSYQAVVAAKAAGVPVELIQSLKGKDFTQVTQHAQNFLIAQE